LAELLEELGESLDGLMEKIASFNESLQSEFDSLLTSTRESISEELSLLIDDIKDQLIGLVLFGVLLLTQATGATMGAYDFIRLNEEGGVLERGTFSVFVAIFYFLFWAASFFSLVTDTRLTGVIGILGCYGIVTGIVNTGMTVIFGLDDHVAAFLYPLFQCFLIVVEYLIMPYAITGSMLAHSVGAGIALASEELTARGYMTVDRFELMTKFLAGAAIIDALT